MVWTLPLNDQLMIINFWGKFKKKKNESKSPVFEAFSCGECEVYIYIVINEMCTSLRSNSKMNHRNPHTKRYF